MKPDVFYHGEQAENHFLRSWSASPSDFINDEHRAIFAKTAHLHGWQADNDSFKLFEMGYYCGDIILEIGVYGGRSAVVSLLGALSNPARTKRPRYYGIDIDLEGCVCGIQNITAMGLIQDALVFCGDLQRFIKDVPVTPTMVFVDGDHSYSGVKSDLSALAGILRPGTPVLCHDWRRPESAASIDVSTIIDPPASKNLDATKMWIGVQKACAEWVSDGYAIFAGAFGSSALYVTTERCNAPMRTIPEEQFQAAKNMLQQQYLNYALEYLRNEEARNGENADRASIQSKA